MKIDHRISRLFRRLFSGWLSLPDDVAPSETQSTGMSDEIPQDNSATIDDATQSVLDSTPLCCVLWTENGNCFFCNSASINLFGPGCMEYFNRFAAESERETWAEAVESGRTVFPWQFRIDGNRDILAEVTLDRRIFGDRHWIAAWIRDLSSHKKTETERDQERLLLHGIIDSSPVCFAVIIDGATQLVTPFLTEFLGLRVGETLRNYFVDVEKAENLCRELIANRSVDWRSITLRARNGDIKEMLANLYYIDYYGTEAVMLWLVDVTQARKTEAELRMARDAAEASVRTKSEFLANMSHEIRTPMNAILGMTHLALRTELTPKQVEYVEGVEQSAKLLLRIINDILDFSKIEAGRMIMEYREFPLKEVLDDVRAVVAESAKKKNLPFVFDVYDDVPERLMGDSVRLHQVLLNLTNNAIKFTAKGAVRVAIRALEQDGLSAELEFSVQDTGIGMKREQVASLFKPFSQADTSTTRKYGGTGLGLAISKRIVEMMKGTISCESVPDKGTVFTFTARFGLPLEGDTIQDISEIRTDALLLGDRPESLQSIRHYLELLKCRIIAQCESVEELDGFLKEDRMREVDFIVFDFDELVDKGLPVFRLLHDRLDGSLPPIAATKHPEIRYVLKETGLTEQVQTIQKPVAVSELFNIMMDVTARKKEQLLHEKKHDGKEEDGNRSLKTYTIPESLRGARILLAEDNRINQIVASEMLQMEGFDVSIAGTGVQAVDMVRNSEFDLVLMDIQMPEMDGLEAARIIRSEPRFRDLPILAMTAHAMMGDRETSLQAGMNDHITKPIDPNLLFGAMVKWIRR